MTGPDCRCGRCVRRDVFLLWEGLRTFPVRVRVACAAERPGCRGPFVVRWGWA